jgi:hypothetical protein
MCARSLGVTVGSSPTVGIHVCLVSVVCCQRFLRRADHTSRGVLQTIVYIFFVMLKPREREGPGPTGGC